MDSTKTRLKSQNKFLSCFKPAAVEDQPFLTVKDDSGDPVFAYVAVEDRENVRFPPLSPDFSPENEVGGGRKKKRYKHAVLWVMKASKKSKREKLGTKSSKSENESVSKPDKMSTMRSEKFMGEDSFGDNSNVRFHSSISSSICSSSSEQNKSVQLNSIDDKFQEHGKGWYGSSVGGVLLILSLFVLIFWGKTCAIFCTSTWLFFVPRWNGRFVSPENGVGSPEIDSDSMEYKKKIIMEGLLERSRCRGS